jgi:soluble lytic murein transglycosylase-like protein
MKGTAAGCLMGAALAIAVTAATAADAETYGRATRDSATLVAAAQPAPTYRRAAFTPAAIRGERDIWSAEREAYRHMVAEAAAQHAVPERLIWAVIRVESGFDHRAVSPKGARGLMQLMPETAAILGVRDALDPRENIQAGTRHLRAMMERFPRDVRLAVAAYNAGEKAVAAARGIPPYPETRDYVSRVMRFYRAARGGSEGYVSASPSFTGARTKATSVAPATPTAPSAAPADVALGGNVERFVAVDGTVTYTNIPYTRVSAVTPAR